MIINKRAKMLRTKQNKASHNCKRFLEKGNQPIIYDRTANCSKREGFNNQYNDPNVRMNNTTSNWNESTNSNQYEFNDKIFGRNVMTNYHESGNY